MSKHYDAIKARRDFFRMTMNDIDKMYKKLPEESQETKERKSINQDIMRLISEGRNKTDVIEYLNSKYTNSKLTKYFESWYIHHSSKQNISKGKEDEER